MIFLTSRPPKIWWFLVAHEHKGSLKMKIKFMSLILAIAAVFVASAANAATMCGPVNSDGWIYHDGKPYVCLRSANTSDNMSAEFEHFGNDLNFSGEGICVNYNSTKSGSYYTYLTYCTLTNSYACASDYYWDGSQCLECPSGTSAAADGEYHNNTSCNYSTGGSSDKSYTCAYNYYDTGSGCELCPGGNAASTPDDNAHNNTKCNYCYGDRYYYDDADETCYPCPGGGQNIGDNEISECYITGGSDATGTYRYTENCYWSE